MNSKFEKGREVSMRCSLVVHTTGYCEPGRRSRAQRVPKSLKETVVYNLLRGAESFLRQMTVGLKKVPEFYVTPKSIVVFTTRNYWPLSWIS
jgi:hypothetical protein